MNWFKLPKIWNFNLKLHVLRDLNHVPISFDYT